MSHRTLRFLLAMYPRSWRDRYGEEFAHLISDLHADHQRTRLSTGLDLLAGAISVQATRRPTRHAATALGATAAIAAVLGGTPLLATGHHSPKAPRSTTTAATQILIVRNRRGGDRPVVILRSAMPDHLLARPRAPAMPDRAPPVLYLIATRTVNQRTLLRGEPYAASPE
jgi:hypothetical protein